MSDNAWTADTDGPPDDGSNIETVSGATRSDHHRHEPRDTRHSPRLEAPLRLVIGTYTGKLRHVEGTADGLLGAGFDADTAPAATPASLLFG
jgi:hypothetical protein